MPLCSDSTLNIDTPDAVAQSPCHFIFSTKVTAHDGRFTLIVANPDSFEDSLDIPDSLESLTAAGAGVGPVAGILYIL